MNENERWWANQRASLAPYYRPAERGSWAGDVLFYLVLTLALLGAFMIGKAGAEDQDKLSIRLTSQDRKHHTEAAATVVPQGQSLVVYCHVPRDDRNRHVEAGLAGERRSTVDVEGAAAPITHRFVFNPRECGKGEAYCAVYRTRDEQDAPTGGLVKTEFLVTGLTCE